ncbi:MAG: hypothetical protein KGH72_01825 [Candidatus Micrarchaeota archaeon]|nr:hypothetical protein [Candidatus Micrarchaeota archaeon]
MSNILAESYETYRENLKLIVLFSISFVIAFAIPLLAPLPTYISAGAIFLRNASIFSNGNVSAIALVVITLSTIFSMLFLSFAFVAISLIVKARKTHVNISNRAFNDIEKYVGKVFIIFAPAMFIVLMVNLLGYISGGSAFLTPVIEFIIFTLIFYAPAAIVIDNKSIVRSIKESIRLVVGQPKYFVLWLVLAFVIISLADLVIIFATGTFWSRYIMLVVNSLFITPYFVILAVESYTRRFKLLSH